MLAVAGTLAAVSALWAIPLAISVRQPVRAAAARPAPKVASRVRNHRRRRAAMIDQACVVVRRQQRVQGNGHDAGIQRAQKHHRPFVAIEKQQQNALFRAHAQLDQCVAEPARARGQIAVREFAVVVDICDLFRSSRI